MIIFWHILMLLVSYVSIRVVFYFHFRKKYDFFWPWFSIICLIVLSTFYSRMDVVWAHFLGTDELKLATQLLIMVLPMWVLLLLAYRQEKQRMGRSDSPVLKC